MFGSPVQFNGCTWEANGELRCGKASSQGTTMTGCGADAPGLRETFAGDNVVNRLNNMDVAKGIRQELALSARPRSPMLMKVEPPRM